MVADGLQNAEGDTWIRHRKIMNPAFRLKKLKVIPLVVLYLYKMQNITYIIKLVKLNFIWNTGHCSFRLVLFEVSSSFAIVHVGWRSSLIYIAVTYRF